MGVVVVPEARRTGELSVPRDRIGIETGPVPGVVTINATQTVLFNPQGVESAVRPAMYATLKQVTKLRNGAGGWKVIAFENTFGRMDSLTSR